MRAAGAHEEAIRSFEDAYTRLRQAVNRCWRRPTWSRSGDVPRSRTCPRPTPREALAQTALIKLNGGLATTMGLRGPSR